MVDLACPSCRAALEREPGRLLCAVCDVAYPIVDGIPVLLPKEGSLFSASVSASAPERAAPDERTSGHRGRAFRRLSRFLPHLGGPYARSPWRIGLGAIPGGRGLVVGAGESGGLRELLAEKLEEVVLTDVHVRAGIDVVCDGHFLPFPDDSFDFVSLAAVLEHVLEPARVVSEVTRVLKKGGVVLADTPLMQQVHMGAYDFQRFTDLGHRWLFRCYDEIERDIGTGPASSLAWSLTYFLVGFADTPRQALAMKGIGRLAFSWVNRFDRLQRRRSGVYDGACSVWFVGRNQKQPVITPEELVKEYRGAIR